MKETYLLKVLCMPADHPILPGSYKWAPNTPKGSCTAGNSKNYEKKSKIRNIMGETYLLKVLCMPARCTPPCTPWSLFWSKSAVCATSTTAWVAMLVVTQQAVSACHRPVTRPNGGSSQVNILWPVPVPVTPKPGCQYPWASLLTDEVDNDDGEDGED